MGMKFTEDQQRVIDLRNCNILVSAAAGSGKTAVLDCRLGAHIAPEGYSGWNGRPDTSLARFAAAGRSGPGARQRPDWVAAPSAADAAALLARARKLCRP